VDTTPLRSQSDGLGSTSATAGRVWEVRRPAAARFGASPRPGGSGGSVGGGALPSITPAARRVDGHGDRRPAVAAAGRAGDWPGRRREAPRRLGRPAGTLSGSTNAPAGASEAPRSTGMRRAMAAVVRGRSRPRAPVRPERRVDARGVAGVTTGGAAAGRRLGGGPTERAAGTDLPAPWALSAARRREGPRRPLADAAAARAVHPVGDAAAVAAAAAAAAGGGSVGSVAAPGGVLVGVDGGDRPHSSVDSDGPEGGDADDGGDYFSMEHSSMPVLPRTLGDRRTSTASSSSDVRSTATNLSHSSGHTVSDVLAGGTRVPSFHPFPRSVSYQQLPRGRDTSSSSTSSAGLSWDASTSSSETLWHHDKRTGGAAAIAAATAAAAAAATAPPVRVPSMVSIASSTRASAASSSARVSVDSASSGVPLNPAFRARAGGRRPAESPFGGRLAPPTAPSPPPVPPLSGPSGSVALAAAAEAAAAAAGGRRPSLSRPRPLAPPKMHRFARAAAVLSTALAPLRVQSSSAAAAAASSASQPAVRGPHWPRRGPGAGRP